MASLPTVDQLRRLLADAPADVVAAYLFGSVAGGTACATSVWTSACYWRSHRRRPWRDACSTTRPISSARASATSWSMATANIDLAVMKDIVRHRLDDLLDFIAAVNRRL